MLKRVISGVVCLILSVHVFAQTDTSEVFAVVEKMPVFPGCGDDVADAEDCGKRKLLEFLYKNLKYPKEAIKGNIEGTTVISFVVEKDGSISNSEILRDIGGGCGAEGLRVIELINEQEIRWQPGMRNGEAVRVKFNLPVRFKLTDESRPFVDVDGVQVWRIFDKDPSWSKGSKEELEKWFAENSNYPKEAEGSCLKGDVYVSFVIQKNGKLTNFSFEWDDYIFKDQFTAETERLVKSIRGKLKPGKINKKKVASLVTYKVGFKNASSACAVVYPLFEKAFKAIDEKDDETALEMYSAILEKMPEEVNAKLGKASILIRAGLPEYGCPYLIEIKDIHEVGKTLLDIYCK